MKFARLLTDIAIVAALVDVLLLYCGGSYKDVVLTDLGVAPFVAFAVALSIGLKG